MIRPAAAFIGLRYLRTHRSNQFASFVTIASVAGVALGVAALIVVLSVMNGFENELRTRLLSMTGHATVSAQQGLTGWRQMRDDLEAFPGVSAAIPYVELEAMLSSGSALSGAILVGVDPEFEQQESEVAQHMRVGSLTDLTPGSHGIILGRALALKLGVRAGDSLTVMVPRMDPVEGLVSGLRSFSVVGVYEIGLKDHDGVRALIHLQDASVLAGHVGLVTGIQVRVEDVFGAPELIRAWQAAWARDEAVPPKVRDWTQDNATYFRAVKIEKIMMTLLLSLIVGVAVFNIVATLVMVVTDKRASIAILRTMGFSKRTIVSVFSFQGILIGWVGVVTGVTAGALLAINVDVVAPALERLFGFEFMPGDVYYLTALPSDLHVADILWIAAIALLMTAVSAVYPALRAADVAPAEVLRYE